MRSTEVGYRLLRAVAGAVVVVVLAACGVDGPSPDPLPAAYFIDGVEYAFEYQLDAQGRVENYRISRRASMAYPTPAESDANLIECTGSLYGAYDCRGTAPAASQ